MHMYTLTEIQLYILHWQGDNSIPKNAKSFLFPILFVPDQ